MPTKMINDWKPEVGSFLNRLEKAGLTIRRGDNGEYACMYPGQIPKVPLKPDSETVVCKTRAEFLEHLLACDECRVYAFDASNGNENNMDPAKRVSFYLVLGNSPGELICDYSWAHAAEGTPFLATVDRIADEHAAEWDGKPQPKMESPYDNC